MGHQAIVVRGFLGWANPGSGVSGNLEAYGPEGRWGRNRQGHLLGDALAEAGQSEGAQLFVVAVPRSAQPHGDADAHEALMGAIERAVSAAVEAALPDPSGEYRLLGKDAGGCSIACSEMHTFSWPCEQAFITVDELLWWRRLRLRLAALFGRPDPHG